VILAATVRLIAWTDSRPLVVEVVASARATKTNALSSPSAMMWLQHRVETVTPSVAWLHLQVMSARPAKLGLRGSAKMSGRAPFVARVMAAAEQRVATRRGATARR